MVIDRFCIFYITKYIVLYVKFMYYYNNIPVIIIFYYKINLYIKIYPNNNHN